MRSTTHWMPNSQEDKSPREVGCSTLGAHTDPQHNPIIPPHTADPSPPMETNAHNPEGQRCPNRRKTVQNRCDECSNAPLRPVIGFQIATRNHRGIRTLLGLIWFEWTTGDWEVTLNIKWARTFLCVIRKSVKIRCWNGFLFVLENILLIFSYWGTFFKDQKTDPVLILFYFCVRGNLHFTIIFLPRFFYKKHTAETYFYARRISVTWRQGMMYMRLSSDIKIAPHISHVWAVVIRWLWDHFRSSGDAVKEEIASKPQWHEDDVSWGWFLRRIYGTFLAYVLVCVYACVTIFVQQVKNWKKKRRGNGGCGWVVMIPILFIRWRSEGSKYCTAHFSHM